MSFLTQYTGIVLPLDISNIDTDNIIPKQFLRETTRINFGKYLFFNWRYLNDTHMQLNPRFVLNQPLYKNASILLSQKNFGCGSSREHAVWALIDYGFKIIIAPSFADIFYKNSCNNHLLLITLSEVEITSLFHEIKKNKTRNFFTINLIKQTIYTNKKKYFFSINTFYKFCILNNLDNINATLKHNAAITEYEKTIPSYLK